jgi:predicted DNA binding CopG/RHH family protein
MGWRKVMQWNDKRIFSIRGNKDKRLSIRVSEEQLESIKELTKRSGKRKVSDYILSLVMKEIDRFTTYDDMF